MVTTSDIIMETLETLENTRDTHAAERWRGMLRLQQRQTETGYLVVKTLLSTDDADTRDTDNTDNDDDDTR